MKLSTTKQIINLYFLFLSLVIHLLIQQIFVEHFLYVGHCFRHEEGSSEQVHPLMGLFSSGEIPGV